MTLKRILVAALVAPVSAVAQSDKVDTYIKSEMQKNSIPGVSVAMLRNGQVLHDKAYGVASIELGAPVTAKTVFPLASITKTFTASAVMLLVEQGKLSLDANIRTLLPNAPAAWGDVTVRQMLGHTSGLPDVVVNPVTGSWLGDKRLSVSVLAGSSTTSLAIAASAAPADRQSPSVTIATITSL